MRRGDSRLSTALLGHVRSTPLPSQRAHPPPEHRYTHSPITATPTTRAPPHLPPDHRHTHHPSTTTRTARSPLHAQPDHRHSRRPITTHPPPEHRHTHSPSTTHPPTDHHHTCCLWRETPHSALMAHSARGRAIRLNVTTVPAPYTAQHFPQSTAMMRPVSPTSASRYVTHPTTCMMRDDFSYLKP